MQKARLFNVNYQVYLAAIFNVVKNNGARVVRLIPITQARRFPLPHYFTLGLSLPLTVSAWSPFKKSKDSDPNAIKTRNEDSELVKDLTAADYMYVTGELSRNDVIYQQLYKHKDKEEPELLWRLARSTYERAKKVEEAKEKQNIIDEAYALVKKSLELEDNNYAAHKWMAITLNEKSRLAGLKEQITQSKQVKFHMMRAVELNPKDATSAYLLGQWCYSVAEVPWYQQKVAAAIFATPPTSTYEEALGHFLNAENIQPLFYSMNLLMLARTYVKLGDKAKANEYLDKLAALPLKNEEDFLARGEGRQLRYKISPELLMDEQSTK